MPNRELALQVSREAEMLWRNAVAHAVVYGGVGYNASSKRSGTARSWSSARGAHSDHLLKYT